MSYSGIRSRIEHLCQRVPKWLDTFTDVEHYSFVTNTLLVRELSFPFNHGMPVNVDE